MFTVIISEVNMIRWTKIFTCDVLIRQRNVELPWLGAILSPRREPTAPKELQQIVSETDQIPLGGDLFNASQEKLPKLSHLLDLPKDRLHNSFALRVNVPSLEGLKLSSHTLLDRSSLRNASPRALNSFARVFHPFGCKVSINSFGV